MTNLEQRITKLEEDNSKFEQEINNLKQEMNDMSDAWETSEKRVIVLEEENKIKTEKISYLEAKIVEFQPIFDYCKLFYIDVVELIKGKIGTKDRAMDNVIRCAKENLGIDK